MIWRGWKPTLKPDSPQPSCSAVSMHRTLLPKTENAWNMSVLELVPSSSLSPSLPPSLPHSLTHSLTHQKHRKHPHHNRYRQDNHDDQRHHSDTHNQIGNLDLQLGQQNIYRKVMHPYHHPHSLHQHNQTQNFLRISSNTSNMGESNLSSIIRVKKCRYFFVNRTQHDDRTYEMSRHAS